MRRHRLHSWLVTVLILVLWDLTTPVANAEQDEDNEAGDDEVRSRSDTVVFDIDGTITYNECGGLLVRKKSRAAMQLWLEYGYEVVIVTARDVCTETNTRNFLAMWGFPLDDVLEIVFAPHELTTPEEKRQYKRNAIIELSLTYDLNIMYAYGDSTWDFQAYEETSIDVSRVFAFRRNGQPDCMEGTYTQCLEDYTDHLEYIKGQPFIL